MGAHSAATLDYARRRTQYVIDRLKGSDSEVAQHWAHTLEQALLRPTGGTLRDFIGRAFHNGDRLNTFQVIIHLDGAEVSHLTGMWAPAPRDVTFYSPTFFKLGDSRRDYAGVVTLTADDIYIGFAKHGNDAVQMIAYD